MSFYHSMDSLEDLGLPSFSYGHEGFDPAISLVPESQMENTDGSFQWDDRKKRRRSRTF